MCNTGPEQKICVHHLDNAGYQLELGNSTDSIGAVASAIVHLIVYPWIFAAWASLIPHGWWTFPGIFSIGGSAILTWAILRSAIDGYFRDASKEGEIN